MSRLDIADIISEDRNNNINPDNVSLSSSSSYFMILSFKDDSWLSEVTDMDKISLDENTHFKFLCRVSNQNLFLILKPTGGLDEYAPFTYERRLSWEDIIKIHPMFKSCNKDLNKVKAHIDNLFNQKRIKLKKNNDEETILMEITAHCISYEVNLKIPLNRVLTEDKDKSLKKLYEIEKKQIKLFKEIKKYIENIPDCETVRDIKNILDNK